MASKRRISKFLLALNILSFPMQAIADVRRSASAASEILFYVITGYFLLASGLAAIAGMILVVLDETEGKKTMLALHGLFLCFWGFMIFFSEFYW